MDDTRGAAVPGRLMVVVNETLGDLKDPAARQMAEDFTRAVESLIHERNAQLAATVARIDGKLYELDERLSVIEAVAAMGESVMVSTVADFATVLADLRREIGDLST